MSIGRGQYRVYTPSLAPFLNMVELFTQLG